MTQRFIRTDIAIVGAGPAGSIAAIHLAKRGIPCTLIGGGKANREKICGDGLSGKVLSILAKTDPEYIRELQGLSAASASSAVRFFAPSQKMVEIGFRSGNPDVPQGIVCKRSAFDAFLLQKARAFPSIDILENTYIDKVTREGASIHLESYSTQILIQARLVLLATGADRKLPASLVPGYPDISSEGIGIRAYYENVKGLDDKNAIEIHFLRELLPWYFWIFPFRDGSANVGLALPMPLARKQSGSLKELLLLMIERYPHFRERFAEARMTSRPGAHRLPYYTGRQQIAGDHFMLLGDAAHLIDPFTGEGISHAMHSGALAAETACHCLETGDFSLNVTKCFEESVYARMGPELDLGKRLQELAGKARLLNLVIGRASGNEKVRQLLEEMLYSLNTKGRLSRPMFYLKLMLGI